MTIIGITIILRREGRRLETIRVDTTNAASSKNVTTYADEKMISIRTVTSRAVLGLIMSLL